jgi:phage-related protein
VRRTVRFYRASSGKCPVEEFLDSLNPKTAQKVAWLLQLIEELEVVPEQYLKKLTSDIWECRIQFGGSAFRVLCFLDGSVMVLTHGFQKKTRKTPRNEIETAENCRRDYLHRRQG